MRKEAPRLTPRPPQQVTVRLNACWSFIQLSCLSYLQKHVVFSSMAVFISPTSAQPCCTEQSGVWASPFHARCKSKLHAVLALYRSGGAPALCLEGWPCWLLGASFSTRVVECRGDSLIGEELGPCPDRALVSRLCAARNLQDGEARPFCFKCAEDMMLSMQGNPPLSTLMYYLASQL